MKPLLIALALAASIATGEPMVRQSGPITVQVQKINAGDYPQGPYTGFTVAVSVSTSTPGVESFSISLVYRIGAGTEKTKDAKVHLPPPVRGGMPMGRWAGSAFAFDTEPEIVSVSVRENMPNHDFQF